jgi:LytS/YehU family sensor histidine kinase
VPLRAIYRVAWDTSFWTQTLIIGASIFLSSVCWTILRMQAFLWLGQEYDIWKDFGGWYFGSFMVFLSWTSLYFGAKIFALLQFEREQRYLATQQIQEEQLKRLSAETGARQAQIKMLRYQLNPHFLFNTLNSISALIKTNRSDQARSTLSQLSDFLRFSLEKSPNPKVTLADEIQTLGFYLGIEDVRYGPRLVTEFNVSEEALLGHVPSLMLQPIFENAIKYAIAGKVAGGKIKMTARTEGPNLWITVEDSGAGIADVENKTREAIAQKSGVGLINIVERLKSHYADEASLELGRSELGGLRLDLKVPYETSIDTLDEANSS